MIFCNIWVIGINHVQTSDTTAITNTRNITNIIDSTQSKQKIFWINLQFYKGDALRDLVPFTQFKKHVKTPMGDCEF